MDSTLTIAATAFCLLSSTVALPQTQNRVPASAGREEEEDGLVRQGIAWADRNRYIVAGVIIRE